MTSQPATSTDLTQYMVAVPGLSSDLIVPTDPETFRAAHPSLQRFVEFYSFKTLKAAERRAFAMNNVAEDLPAYWTVFGHPTGGRFVYLVVRPMHASDQGRSATVRDGYGKAV